MPRSLYAIGRYWGCITNQRLGESSGGFPQLIIDFEILGRIKPEDPEGDLEVCEKSEQTVYRVITEKSVDWVMQDLEKLGFYGESFRRFDLNEPNAVDLRGKELAFYCDHNEYPAGSGQIKQKWSIASDGTEKPLEDKAVRQLDAMFGAGLKSLPKPKAEEPKAEPAEDAPTLAEDIEQAKQEPAKVDAIPF